MLRRSISTGVRMDILNVLVWLSGAGIAAVSAFVLERIAGFQNLAPQGKQVIATAVAVLVAVCAMWAHDWLTQNPDVLVSAQPYLQIVVSAASIVIQQVAHGVQRSAAENG